MPPKGYADPVMNDGPRFYSNVPVSKLTKRVTRAIEASDVSSAPPVAETVDWITHETQPTPTEPNRAQGLGTPNPSTCPTATPDAWIHDSDSPDPSAAPDAWVHESVLPDPSAVPQLRPMLGSLSLSRLIPRLARCLGWRLRLA